MHVINILTGLEFCENKRKKKINEISEMIFTRQTFVGTHEKRVTEKDMQNRQKKKPRTKFFEKKLNNNKVT